MEIEREKNMIIKICRRQTRRTKEQLRRHHVRIAVLPIWIVSAQRNMQFETCSETQEPRRKSWSDSIMPVNDNNILYVWINGFSKTKLRSSVLNNEKIGLWRKRRRILSLDPVCLKLKLFVSDRSVKSIDSSARAFFDQITNPDNVGSCFYSRIIEDDRTLDPSVRGTDVGIVFWCCRFNL